MTAADSPVRFAPAPIQHAYGYIQGAREAAEENGNSDLAERLEDMELAMMDNALQHGEDIGIRPEDITNE